MSRTTARRQAKRDRLRAAQVKIRRKSRDSKRRRGQTFRFQAPADLYCWPDQCANLPAGSVVEYLRAVSRNRASVRFEGRDVIVHRDHLRALSAQVAAPTPTTEPRPEGRGLLPNQP